MTEMTAPYSYHDIAKLIDHSILSPAATTAELDEGCRIALHYDVASVCLLPYYLKRCADLLAHCGLAGRANQRAGGLTLLDRKRLELARALATDPKLLLLDEVMAGLRPTETDRLVAILKELNRESGLTILLIEHVMRAVMALATHVLVMHHGAVIANGVPNEVVHDRAVIDSYLGAEAVA